MWLRSCQVEWGKPPAVRPARSTERSSTQAIGFACAPLPWRSSIRVRSDICGFYFLERGPLRLGSCSSRIVRRSLYDQENFGATFCLDIVVDAVRAVRLGDGYGHGLIGFVGGAHDEAGFQGDVGDGFVVATGGAAGA